MPYFAIDSWYNDSCNCHPETHEVTGDGDTLRNLSDYVAAEECSRWAPKREEFTVRREFTNEEWDQFLSELADARIRWQLKQEAVAFERKRAGKRAVLSDKISRSRTNLEMYRSELTAEALASREAAIRKLEKELVSC